MEPITGGGSVAYCDGASRCAIAKSSGFVFPNGLVRALDGTIVVPGSLDGQAWALRLHPHNASLTQTATFSLGMPVDNLAVDRTGDIYGAAFPKIIPMVKSFEDPENTHPPTAVVRVRRGPDGAYQVHKVLEDRDGAVLSMATVARHDATTGRFFLGGEWALHMGGGRLLTKVRACRSLYYGL